MSIYLSIFFHYFFVFMTALYELCPRFSVFCLVFFVFGQDSWHDSRRRRHNNNNFQPNHLLICQIQAKTPHVRKYNKKPKKI